jgi:ABC-type lipoprotein export system ATPase subunit
VGLRGSVVAMGGDLFSLVDVCKSYRRGARLLRVLVDVSLEVGSGEIVAVVGSRDEGKTTLMQIAAGLQTPDTGEVWLGDVELTRCSNPEREELWGREVAWIHREGTGLGFQMLEYVSLPLVLGRRCGKREAERAAMEALELVGAPDCAGLLWKELSNWERVLVAFARGIAHKPRLLVVDDVIDGFGMSSTRQAGELLLSFVQELGCGVLMSASDREAALVAERVWSFERGRLNLVFGKAGDEAEVIDLHDEARRARGARGAGS